LAKEVAEFMDESFDYEGAASMYEKAAELYIMDNTPTHGNTLLVKASDLRILTRDPLSYRMAIPNYDKVGRKFLS